MTEVTLELGRAYLIDRINELRHDAQFGTPFVFLGIGALLNTLDELAEKIGFVDAYFDTELPPGLLERYTDLPGADIRQGLRYLGHYFTLTVPKPRRKLNLSHREDNFLNVNENGSVTITPLAMLDVLEDVVKKFFLEVSEDSLASARLYVALNELPFCGYGG